MKNRKVTIYETCDNNVVRTIQLTPSIVKSAYIFTFFKLPTIFLQTYQEFLTKIS